MRLGLHVAAPLNPLIGPIDSRSGDYFLTPLFRSDVDRGSGVYLLLLVTQLLLRNGMVRQGQYVTKLVLGNEEKTIQNNKINQLTPTGGITI